MIARLLRLGRRSLLRPHLALLLFGSLSLVSNWLWFGSGLFLRNPLGIAVWAGGLLAMVGAGLALVSRRRQVSALVILLIAAVAVPALALIALRLKTGAPILMHDGAYQTEEAMRLLVAGRDPYGVDYTTTSMRLWHWYVNTPIDPSLYHFVYSPAVFLLPFPAFVLAQWLHWPFDVRFIELLVDAIAAIAIVRLPWRWPWRYVLLTVLFLDPFFYLPQGRNDMLFLAPIIVAVLAWERGRPLLSAGAFGMALAFKPFAVFYLPLIALLLVRRSHIERWSAARLVVALAFLGLPALITIGPFVAWHPGAYWADTVSFVSGSDPHRYPIQGFAFSQLLLALHAIPNPNAYFPFSLVQLAALVPTAAFAVKRTVARPTLATALAWGAVMLAVFLFFGRFVNDNYLADVVALAVLAATARRGARDSRAARSPGTVEGLSTAA